MKKLLVIAFLTLSSSLLTIHAQNWLWGREAVPKNSYSGGDALGDHTIAVDALGNTYFTGFFKDSLLFGPSLITNTIPFQNVFLAKCDANGNMLWVTAPVIYNDFAGEARSVALDALGNIYEAGYYTDTVSFASFTLKVVSLNGCAYIAKYDANGNVLWAKGATPASSSSYSYVFSIATDGPGNVYVTGGFCDTVTFGTFTLKAAGNAMFLVKYDVSGNTLWAKQSGASSNRGYVTGYSIAVDNFANTYITGEFLDTVSFGAYSLEETSINGSVFIAKYDPSGNILWAKQGMIASNYCEGIGNSIAVDGSGNAYITGNFRDTLSFGAYTLKSIIPYHSDIFLVKYNPSGNVVWAEAGIDTDINDNWYGFSVACDTLKRGGGYLIVNGTGVPSYKLKFGSDTFQSNTPYGIVTVFLQFDSSGKAICGNMFSEGIEDDGDGVGVDKSGKYVYMDGDLANTTIFANDTLIYGNDIPFVARWHPCSQNNEGVNNPQSNNFRVVIYPNPNKGQFTIEVQGVRDKEQVDIYNMLGEKIYSTSLSINNSTFNINLGSQPNGVYLYRVLTETGSLVSDGKFVIQK